MPRVRPLTEAQAEAQKAEKRRKVLADCLTVYKENTGKTDEQVAKDLGLSTYILRQIRNKEEALMDISATVRLLAAGGFEITRKAVTL